MERAVFTEQIATDITLPNPNMSVYRRYRDTEHIAYRVYPNEGYVMYNPNEIGEVENPETGEMETIIQYFTMVGCPLNTDFSTFPYIAVLRSTVDENDIFGDETDKEHEAM